MGVSTATISDWKKGKIIPRMDKVDKLCTYFHISRSELLGSPSDTKHDTIYPPPASDNFTHQEHNMIDAYRNAPASVMNYPDALNRAMKEFANMLSGNVDVSAKQKA